MKDIIIGVAVTVLVGGAVERFFFKNPAHEAVVIKYQEQNTANRILEASIDSSKTRTAEKDHLIADLKETARIQAELLDQPVLLRGMNENDIDNAIALRVERERARRQHSDSLHTDH